MKPDTLYVDRRRRFAIGYFADSPLSLTEPVDASDWDDTSDIPILRAVYTLEDFNEKIQILEEGLDDVAIERMKFFVARVMLDKISSAGDMRFTGRVRCAEWLDEMVHGIVTLSYSGRVSRKVTTVDVPMGLYYEELYACTVDPRMNFGEGGALVVNAALMTLRLMTPRGKVFPYYREESIDGRGIMITRATFRRTPEHPTLRLWGLAHADGYTLFPPIFDYAEERGRDSGRYYVSGAGVDGMVSPFGGLHDLYQRIFPEVPVVDLEKYKEDLKKWLDECEMHVYYRDTELDAVNGGGGPLYEKGGFIRAGFFVDATSSVGRAAEGVRTRFVIVSNRGVKLHDVPGIGDQNPSLLMWDLTVFDFNAIFYVLDEYVVDGVRIVMLLHVPASLVGVAEDNDMKETLAGLDETRNCFKDSINCLEVSPLSMNVEWKSRTRALIGVNEGRELFSVAPVETPDDETVEIVRGIIETEGGLDDVRPEYKMETRSNQLYRGSYDGSKL